MNKLSIEYDEGNDLVLIDGIRYTGELFRTMALGSQPDRLFKILSVADGIVSIKIYRIDELAFEIWHAAQEEKRMRQK